MATFAKRPPAPKPPPPDAAVDLTALAETIIPSAPTAVPDPAPAPIEEPARRTKGRPPSPEARVVFGTQPKADTIADVEAIERAMTFYRAHLIAKTRAGLRLGPEIDDEAAAEGL